MKSQLEASLSFHPTLQEVIIYFCQQGSSLGDARQFHAFYQDCNWKNGAGRTIENWKKTAWTWIWYGKRKN